MAVVRHKEAIHSGHFMISDFEAEAEDEEDIAVPPPEEGSNLKQQLMSADEEADKELEQKPILIKEPEIIKIPSYIQTTIRLGGIGGEKRPFDMTLNQLFRSMSIAYRQKLTSPKWNRFRGLKLRWKDKIRLNNVIWRCWHMQFVKGENKLLCAFANPLEIDNHNKTEGSTLLEGKYWKRKLQTITKEYMRWRMFYKNRGADEGTEISDQQWDILFQSPFQCLEGSKDDAALEAMAPEEDFLMDALFSTLNFDTRTQQALAVPLNNPNDKYRSTNADFIQPGLVQLQPNLEDFFMDLDSQPSWLSSNPKLPNLTDASQQQEQQQQQNSNNINNQMYEQPSGQPQELQQRSNEPQKQMIKPKSQAMAMYNNMPSQDPQLMSNYPIDLQAPPNAQVLPQVNQFVQPQQQEQQRARPTVMDLASVAVQQQQEQQQQVNNAPYLEGMTSKVNNTLYPPFSNAQKKPQQLSGTIMCSSGKRHSPKHRILHHREFGNAQDQPALPPGYPSNATTVSNLPTDLIGPRSALHEPASPYKMPQHLGIKSSAEVAARQQQQQQLGQYLEPREGKIRSLSGPPSLPQMHNPALNEELKPVLAQIREENVRAAQPNNASSSELIVQLLKNSGQSGLSFNSLPPGVVQQMSDRQLLQHRQVPLKTEPTNYSTRDDDRGYPFAGKSETLNMNTLRNLEFQVNAGSSPAAPTPLHLSVPSGSSSYPSDIAGNASPEAVATTNPRPPIRKSMPSAPMGSKPIPPPPARDLQARPTASHSLPQTPVPSTSSFRGRTETPQYQEHRRNIHINAEQKRRGSIKNGFDLMRSLIPTLNQNSNVKISKAALLHKGGDYLVQLKEERKNLSEEITSLKAKIDVLNGSLQDLHKNMASSTSIAADTYEDLEKLFDAHTLACTQQNWKYWAFSLFMHPLLASYQSSVDASSFEDMHRTSINWIDQHLSANQLRPLLIKSLVDVSKRTDIISGGDNLPEQFLAEAAKGNTKEIESAMSAKPKIEPSDDY